MYQQLQLHELMLPQMSVQSKEGAQGRKGKATAATRSRGKSVHASTPADGATAVDDDFEILDDEWDGTPVTGAITMIASDSSQEDFIPGRLSSKLQPALRHSRAVAVADQPDARPKSNAHTVDGGGADSCGRTIFEALEKLIDWLNNETELFPRNFPSNYAELVLSRILRSKIAQEKPMTVQEVEYCVDDKVRVQWLGPYILATVKTAKDLDKLPNGEVTQHLVQMMWTGAWTSCVKETREMKAVAEQSMKSIAPNACTTQTEKDMKGNILKSSGSKRERMDALKPCGGMADGAQLSPSCQLEQFRAPKELRKRRSASAHANG